MNLTAFYSREEAGVALGVSRATISDYIRQGHLRGIRLGRRWLIARESLVRLLQEGTRPATSQQAAQSPTT